MGKDRQLKRLADDELVERCQEGDSAACGILFDRYRHVIYAIACAGGRDRDWCEDAASEITCSVLESLHLFRGDSSFGTWLRRVARCVWVDELRKEQRPGETVPLAEDSVVGQSDLAELAEEHELQAQVLDGIASLPDKPRTAITLRLWGGHSYKKVAEIVGVPIGTVKSRIFQGLRKVRKTLEEEGRGPD